MSGPSNCCAHIDLLAADNQDVKATTLTMEELQVLLAKAKTVGEQDELADRLEARANVAELRRAKSVSPIAAELSCRQS